MVANVDSVDPFLFLGVAPAYAYDQPNDTWRRLRSNSDGYLIVSEEASSSTVITPTTSGTTISNAGAQVLAVMNTTNTVITILDNTTEIAVVPPLSSITAPLFAADSLVVKSGGAALGAKVSIIWKAIP